MDEKINLPIVNEEGCYEIRLESIAASVQTCAESFWENWGHRIWAQCVQFFQLWF